MFYKVLSGWNQSFQLGLNFVSCTGHSNGGDAARKVAANLANDNINVDLLFLFDMVPKPWEFGEPGTRSKPVSNAAVAVENFQRDDIRTLGIWPLETWLQGWLITGGSNSQFTTQFPPHGDGPVDFFEPDGTQRRRFPHTEMVYNASLKLVLENRINSINP